MEFYCESCESTAAMYCREECDRYDGAPIYRPGMGPEDPVRCDND